MLKTLRIISLGIVTVVVLCMLGVSSIIIFRHLRGDQLLSVQTGSMVPTFYPGDAVLTAKVSLEQLKIGDIVTYTNPNDKRVVVSHRLTEINYQTGKLITAGDALNLLDIPFPASLVTGRVYKAVPVLGSVLNWLHQPAGLIIAVYTPAAFVLVSEAKRLSRHYSDARYQTFDYVTR